MKVCNVEGEKEIREEIHTVDGGKEKKKGRKERADEVEGRRERR